MFVRGATLVRLVPIGKAPRYKKGFTPILPYYTVQQLELLKVESGNVPGYQTYIDDKIEVVVALSAVRVRGFLISLFFEDML